MPDLAASTTVIASVVTALVTSDGKLHPAVFLVFLAFGVIVAFYSYREDRKRRRLLRTWAKSQGFVMNEATTRGWEREYPAFKIFERGDSRHTARHLDGTVDGRRVRCLDYRYATGSGKNRRRHRFGIVLIDTGTPVIPLTIRREHIGDRIGDFFGQQDINFESAEFSRRFHVSSADRKWAYDVIHAGMIDYLMTLPPVTIAFGFTELAVWRTGALEASKVHEDLKIARRLLDLIPADVLAQLRGGKP
jgi:hypothetical protein